MLTLAKCAGYLRRFGTYFTQLKIKKTNEASRKFAIFRLKQGWKKRIRNCGGLDFRLMNYCRYSLGLLVVGHGKQAKDHAKSEAFAPFLKEYIYRESLKMKFRKAYKTLLFI